MLLLSREDIKKVITMKDIIEADKKAFQMVVEGTCELPPVLIFRRRSQMEYFYSCLLMLSLWILLHLKS